MLFTPISSTRRTYNSDSRYDFAASSCISRQSKSHSISGWSSSFAKFTAFL